MGDHDHSYKLLFAHAQMVRELLETFVGGDWLAQVDFNTLERVSDGYISDDLRARADDIVWRVRCGVARDSACRATQRLDTLVRGRQH